MILKAVHRQQHHHMPYKEPCGLNSQLISIYHQHVNMLTLSNFYQVINSAFLLILSNAE